jgi:hypothetical protein
VTGMEGSHPPKQVGQPGGVFGVDGIDWLPVAGAEWCRVRRNGGWVAIKQDSPLSRNVGAMEKNLL